MYGLRNFFSNWTINTTLVVGVLSFLGTLIGTMISSNNSNQLQEKEFEAELIKETLRLNDSALIVSRFDYLCNIHLLSEERCRNIKNTELRSFGSKSEILITDTIRVGVTYADKITNAYFFVSRLEVNENNPGIIYGSGKIGRPNDSGDSKLKTWENYSLPNMWEYTYDSKLYHLTLLPIRSDSMRCLFTLTLID